MPEIKNTFLKGKMNQDLDSRLLPNGEYREAINLMISRSEGSTVGEFENLLGNTSISLLGTNNEAVIGHYVNETTNKVYLFATDYNDVDGVRSTNSENFIYELDLSAPYDKKVLVTGGFLNFNQSFPITGVNLVEDLLFWTDNLNQPRKINISLANPTAKATPTHYTTEDHVSVAKYAPCESIYLMDRINTRINGAVSPASTSITVDDATGIKIGDIISPFEVLTSPPDVAQWNKLVYVIKIDGNNLVLSQAITVTNSFKVVFDRSTCTQKSKLLKSNGLTTTIAAGGVIDATHFKLNYPGTTDGYSDILPKLGDIITGPGKLISDNLTIIAAQASYANGAAMLWTFTTSAAHGFSDGDEVNMSVNPDFDDSWGGDPKFLEDKFIRFSYRFKFEDNEYSLMAPFTQPVFIPKQYSEFGGGQFTNKDDMDAAYKATIVNWFENNVQNIVLKVPLPYSTSALVSTNLLITDIEILYKESDALAVKVLDSIGIENLPTGTLPKLDFYDGLHGENANVYYYAYDYTSSKPYKTLPSSQTVRVYDKVPIKALAQEVIGNRVVYGNYVDKQTSPNPLNFSAIIGKKKPYYNNVIQYPYQNLKQSRTYQVGIILADRYGRQSDVVLSAYDDIEGVAGSTVFSEYNTQADQEASPIIDWIGDSLNIQFDTALGQETTGGQPGVWNATTNPLGWYSYKVVVKQQEQEYYNVYLPGWVNGLPITEDLEENKSSFTILLSDNINKVPRDLKEVGPTDTEYTSSQTLRIRVNNPNINNKGAGRPYGYPQKDTSWNKQYYPASLTQEVIAISTVRDMEIAAIPFVVAAPEGPYGQTGTIENPAGTIKPIAIGSIPWGTSPGDINQTAPNPPSQQPFYNSDLNPFAIKIDTTANGVSTLSSSSMPVVPGAVGAVCTTKAPSGGTYTATQNIITMIPCLSVAETEPVYSLLELFYETSLQGKLNTLNSLINAQYPGVTNLNKSDASFAESIAPQTQIGNNIIFQTGGGTAITANGEFRDTNHNAVAPRILSAYRASDVNQATDVSHLFEFVYTNSNAEYKLQSAAGEYFWYGSAEADNPSAGEYNITFETVYTPGAVGTTTYTNTTAFTAILTNVAPSFSNCSNPTGITIASTTIKTFTAVNGTNASNTGNTTNQLIFDLDPSNAASILNGFTMSSEGVLTANNGTLVDQSSYTIKARVRDVNGNGLSATCDITFTVGTQHVPQAICYGRIGTAVAVCNQSYETFFGASNTTSSTGAYGTIDGIVYPGNAIQFYNVRANAAAGSTTGALTQGVMNITPNLTRIGAGSVSCYVSIQHRNNAQSQWTQAVDTGNNVIQNISLTASNGAPGTITKTFSATGEYRVFSTNVTGEGCGSGTVGLSVSFGDATYNNQCALGPL